MPPAPKHRLHQAYLASHALTLFERRRTKIRYQRESCLWDGPSLREHPPLLSMTLAKEVWWPPAGSHQPSSIVYHRVPHGCFMLSSIDEFFRAKRSTGFLGTRAFHKTNQTECWDTLSRLITATETHCIYYIFTIPSTSKMSPHVICSDNYFPFASIDISWHLSWHPLRFVLKSYGFHRFPLMLLMYYLCFIYDIFTCPCLCGSFACITQLLTDQGIELTGQVPNLWGQPWLVFPQ